MSENVVNNQNSDVQNDNKKTNDTSNPFANLNVQPTKNMRNITEGFSIDKNVKKSENE